MQTYTPHHPAMQAVRRDDFVGFCAQEAGFRKELGYPPYARLISLSFRGRVEAQVAAAADAISKGLTAAVDARIRVSPAVPAAIARIKGAYRFQVLLRGRSVMAMTGPIRQLMRDHAMPNGVTSSVDVDAVNLM